MREYAHSFNTWRPSIRMPREAARLFLRVKDVGVERLQDIGLEDAVAEGCITPNQTLYVNHKGYFADLWTSTIKPADLPRYGWEANPWVWVIAFERISKEAAQREEGQDTSEPSCHSCGHDCAGVEDGPCQDYVPAPTAAQEPTTL